MRSGETFPGLDEAQKEGEEESKRKGTEEPKNQRTEPNTNTHTKKRHMIVLAAPRLSTMLSSRVFSACEAISENCHTHTARQRHHWLDNYLDRQQSDQDFFFFFLLLLLRCTREQKITQTKAAEFVGEKPNTDGRTDGQAGGPGRAVLGATQAPLASLTFVQA